MKAAAICELDQLVRHSLCSLCKDVGGNSDTEAPAPWTSGRDPPAPEMAAHVAPLPGISDAACRVPRRGDRGKPARRLSAPHSRESQAARGTPEEEAQAEAVGRRGPFRPSPEGPVEALLLTVP